MQADGALFPAAMNLKVVRENNVFRLLSVELYGIEIFRSIFWLSVLR